MLGHDLKEIFSNNSFKVYAHPGNGNDKWIELQITNDRYPNTSGLQFIQLNENETLELVQALTNRLLCKEGFIPIVFDDPEIEYLAYTRESGFYILKGNGKSLDDNTEILDPIDDIPEAVMVEIKKLLSD
jgi:hypothetical protein